MKIKITSKPYSYTVFNIGDILLVRKKTKTGYYVKFGTREYFIWPSECEEIE